MVHCVEENQWGIRRVRWRHYS